ncbi:uncharacterized protein LOC111778762 isoform X1 [Cucurbita pepo subsp. pepo]|uniref:uncharacterized protein LOC111778762 isoform X1 n=1 Tax=Cucurbita pepo subsp. pepo TaxID=3664 RepID=UPI000C9D30B7|nr:uncharacterized protein LOC111778762 isoform X1 [Cucurbita pepo subsp. pepo]
MLGMGLRFGRGRGEDRFYDSSRARKGLLSRQNDRLRRPQQHASATTPSRAVSDVFVPSSITTRPGGRLESDEATEPVAISNPQPAVSLLSNLERFLQSTTPSVPALFLSKSAWRGCRMRDSETQPYFVLGDLWEAFKERSAYGTGVPLLLNNTDGVVQYYVPYLSGIQLYAMESSTRPRRWCEESDSDSSSDGSSDSETKRRIKHSREPPHHSDPFITTPFRMDRLSLRDQHLGLHQDCSSDEAEFFNSQGRLLFEYLERDLPYLREPLADKISVLASRFPQLKTMRSCDLLPHSWISVAWYPIYRIPTGQTLKDLDACFLTYHYLHTPIRSPRSPQMPSVTYPCKADGAKKIPLRIFGLASYKFNGSSLWMRNGGVEHQLANVLSKAADEWLRSLQVNHPDFQFFSRQM